MAIFYDDYYLNEEASQDTEALKAALNASRADDRAARKAERDEKRAARKAEREKRKDVRAAMHTPEGRALGAQLRAQKKIDRAKKKAEDAANRAAQQTAMIQWRASRPGKDAKESVEEAAYDLFNESADYVIGCLNEDYSIDIDLLEEAANYCLDYLDEM